MRAKNLDMKTLAILGIVAVGIVLGGLILTIESDSHSHDHKVEGDDFERGPHDGRLLRDGKTAIEVTIFEKGVPPEFRVYAYTDEQPLEPTKVKLAVQTNRLGGEAHQFAFKPEANYLRAQESVVEPHSFDVNVTATIDGKAHTWTYASYEGRVEISPQAAATSGIKTEIAGAATIRETVILTGQLTVDRTRAAQLRARFPGVLKELRSPLGANVAKGDTIAIVESNDSLQSYTIKAPFDGTIITQNASVGETVGDAPFVEVADLRKIVADLQVFPRDVTKLERGQAARITSIDGSGHADGMLSVIAPTTQAGSQAVSARMLIDNSENFWRPGMLIEAHVTTGAKEVPLAVKTSGLQQFRDFQVVFAKVGNVYEVRMLTLGVTDGESIEVLSGLALGTTYVSGNSYLIKADIEKSGASHDH